MPVADVDSSVQRMVEQMKSGKKELGQSEENFLSKESATLCGVNGKNLLGVENFQFYRDAAHLYWTPTSTLWDRTYQCLHAHGLAKELPIDAYITHRMRGVERTNAAVDALHSGDCLRAVVTY